MADRLLTAMEGEVAGTYIMPSFGRYEQCAELVRRIRARHPAAPTAVAIGVATESAATTAAATTAAARVAP